MGFIISRAKARPFLIAGKIPSLSSSAKNRRGSDKEAELRGRTCTTFELLTELTAQELPDDMMLVGVTFTNTSDVGVTRLTGETKIRKYEDSKIEPKSESNGSEHFGIHLALDQRQLNGGLMRYGIFFFYAIEHRISRQCRP